MRNYFITVSNKIDDSKTHSEEYMICLCLINMTISILKNIKYRGETLIDNTNRI